jgi:hypothetical protein
MEGTLNPVPWLPKFIRSLATLAFFAESSRSCLSDEFSTGDPVGFAVEVVVIVVEILGGGGRCLIASIREYLGAVGGVGNSNRSLDCKEALGAADAVAVAGSSRAAFSVRLCVFLAWQDSRCSFIISVEL